MGASHHWKLDEDVIEEQALKAVEENCIADFFVRLNFVAPEIRYLIDDKPW